MERPPGWSRRELVYSLVGATVLALPARSLAALQCGDTPQGRVCEAGIPSALVHEAARAEPQFQSQWCWAACIAMVFRYYGHPVDQATIVEEAYGSQVNMPAQPWTVLSSLNRSWVDKNGQPFSSMASGGVPDPSYAAQDLANGMPLIIGTQSHAMVLTALTYAAPWMPGMWGPMLGQPQVTRAKVRDPWPGNGLRDLSPQEWFGISFATQVRVS